MNNYYNRATHDLKLVHIHTNNDDKILPLLRDLADNLNNHPNLHGLQIFLKILHNITYTNIHDDPGHVMPFLILG